MTFDKFIGHSKTAIIAKKEIFVPTVCSSLLYSYISPDKKLAVFKG